MKMKLSGLLIGVLLLLSPGLIGQKTLSPPSPGGPALSGVPTPGCGSVWKGTAFETDAVWTIPAGVGASGGSSRGGGGGGGALAVIGLLSI